MCIRDSLYPYPTDMRKSFYTLSGIVTNQMGKNVRDGEPESLNFSLSVILYEMLAEEIRRFFLEVLLISLMVQ